MTPRLHVLLGPGGVGKTTLAAGYALALASRGHRVGLLGIDPSQRLQDALGVALSDREVAVPGAGELYAAIVHPHQALERWVGEHDARLVANPFFGALGDRLATAIDIFAAARVAEWAERDPSLTDLVVDTAPGLPALEFLRSPRQLDALVSGRMLRWLRAASSTGRLRGTARRVLGAFAGIAGARMVIDLADFFTAVHAPLEHMVKRVERTREWIASADLLLVTSPRDTDAAGAAAVRRALAGEDLAPRAVIVNRTWPQVPVVDATPFGDYVRALFAAQAAVLAEVATWHAPMLVLPSRSTAGRAALAGLGAVLYAALAPIEARSAS